MPNIIAGNSIPYIWGGVGSLLVLAPAAVIIILSFYLKESTRGDSVMLLLEGLCSIIVLIGVALIILSWSYFKEQNRSPAANWEHPHPHPHRDGDGDGGRNEMTEDHMPNISEDKYETRVVVIMAGEENPSFIAKPSTMSGSVHEV